MKFKRYSCSVNTQ